MKLKLWKELFLVLMFTTICQQLLAGLLLPNNIPVWTTDSSAKTNSAAVDVSIPLQLPVQPFVNTYLEEHADLLDKIKAENGSTFIIIQKILLKRGVPQELMYLAIVESKLKNKATSGAGAAGVWQLMPATARTLGLKVNGKTDERRNIYQSSVAAADYLNTLYSEFDDWLLTVAAYNCGAGNVQKAIKLSGSREFWKLQYHLPKETRDHVKRFIATHFYYEGEGSAVTLTRKERLHFFSSIEQPVATKTKKETAFTNTASVNFILLVEEEGKPVMLMRK
jgi:membrane-bound lytic murein transglycosylase D